MLNWQHFYVKKAWGKSQKQRKWLFRDLCQFTKMWQIWKKWSKDKRNSSSWLKDCESAESMQVHECCSEDLFCSFKSMMRHLWSYLLFLIQERGYLHQRKCMITKENSCPPFRNVRGGQRTLLCLQTFRCCRLLIVF